MKRKPFGAPTGSRTLGPFREFGLTLEPEVVKTSGLALGVRIIAPLVGVLVAIELLPCIQAQILTASRIRPRQQRAGA